MESIKAAKIQEHVIKDAGWIRGEVSYEISRLESLYLNEKHVCKSLADMHAPHAAQSDVLRLRESAFRSAYAGVR